MYTKKKTKNKSPTEILKIEARQTHLMSMAVSSARGGGAI